MFPNLKTAEVSEVTNYLTAGVHSVKIDEIKSSSSVEGYKGNPYVEYKVSNSEGIQYIKFWGITKDTSEKAAKVKTEMFKTFLHNAGVKNFDVFVSAAKEAVGKNINVCLSEEEYWNNDRDTGEPKIRKAIRYKFSSPVGQSITWKESYNKSLPIDQMAEFKAAHEAHISAMTGGVESTDDFHSADDLNNPF
jgi:hypothetical protein